MAERFWEVDFARGIAIVMMLLSNFLFDLYFFAGCSSCYAGFWFYFARATAFLFILLAGVSLTLSYSRLESKAVFKKYMKRGLRIFSWGILITIITWALIGEGFVLFGILHLIGVSVILGHLLLRFRFLNLVLGLTLIIASFFLQNISGHAWLLWTGLAPYGFFSIDYTPLIPWFGVFLIGIFLGNSIYPKGKQRLPKNTNPIVKGLSLLGRRSLLIYFAHQPIFIVLLFMWLNIPVSVL
ncbi:MAG: DUF1624 domain-containing protein [Candidatus Aenigmarchaeota archaeon]|nr:DUF1624 domain-containing protein [Candidatus Aenigmarchaeota archaeon]